MAELEELQDINTELDSQTIILEDILIELQTLNISGDDIILSLEDTNIFLENQEIRNIDYDTEFPVLDQRDYINNISDNSNESLAMQSYNFIFIGVFLAFMIVLIISQFFKKV